ncbi:glycosyl hydrolase family 8 [Paenibacillus oceani]|uniref:Glycosyl hydrolase n=1 Tax=Paenibacillus oceani TaxID=2772510 RepID=A0A927H2Z3_9BACL|nr:glycosyl hydrolase family 8 [Paenibacillus oceani]MBD2866330.1 hypothetical protein [Paenibacillus oceani]
MRKKSLLLIGVLAGLTLFFIYKQTGGPADPPLLSLPDPTYGARANVQKERDELETFIQTKLTGPHGVYTNYLDTDQSRELATGHEVLSESASLRMRISALAKDKQSFDKEWALAKRTFDLQKGFSYRYSPKQQKSYPINAAVDDLRMIRALYEAGQAFGDGSYTKEANRYGERFYQYNVKDGRLYDFYDEKYNKTNSFVTLCYADLRTLQLLPAPSKARQTLQSTMQAIVQDGYLGDEFPFYETRYHYDRSAYSSENINTVESLLTILHLAEVKEAKPASIRYLKEHVMAGTLFGQYTRAGEPANSIRSTAIYALTAMIGSEIGDYPLYLDSIGRMNAFQVKQQDSPLYGGFGDVHTNQAYSFDNLMALLAYSY